MFGYAVLTPKSIGLAPLAPFGGSGSLASGLGVEMRAQTHLRSKPLVKTPVKSTENYLKGEFAPRERVKNLTKSQTSKSADA